MGFETNVDSRNLQTTASVGIRQPPSEIDLELDFNYATASVPAGSRAQSTAIESDAGDESSSKASGTGWGKSGFSWSPKSVLPTSMTGSQPPRGPPGAEFLRSGSLPVPGQPTSSKKSIFNRSGSVNNSASSPGATRSISTAGSPTFLSRDPNTRNFALAAVDDEDVASPSQRSISIADVFKSGLAHLSGAGSSSGGGKTPPNKPVRPSKSPPKPPRVIRSKSDPAVISLEKEDDEIEDISANLKPSPRNFSSAAIRAMGAELRNSNSHLAVLSLNMENDEDSASLAQSLLEEDYDDDDSDVGRRGREKSRSGELESVVIGISSIDRDTMIQRHLSASDRQLGSDNS